MEAAFMSFKFEMVHFDWWNFQIYQEVAYMGTLTENVLCLNISIDDCPLFVHWPPSAMSWDMLRKRAVKVHPGQQQQTRALAKSKRFV